MRILYLHQYFCTPSAAAGARSYEFARRWVEHGHHVTVVTSTGYDDSLEPNASNVVDNIQVRAVGGRYSPTMGFFARLCSFAVFSLRTMVIAAQCREYDVVLATSTPLTVALPALVAKFIAHRRVIFEVRDVWPDAAVDAGVLKDPLLVWVARLLEKAAYRWLDHIVPLSTGMEERIKSKGVPASKLTMLPNCSDLGLFDPGQFDKSNLRAKMNATGKFVLLYVGAINLANDMPFLARCIDALNVHRDIEWWFVGDGNRMEYLREKVAESKATNVVFWGKHSKKEVPRFVNAADLGVVSFINQPVYYENSPNKFFDYCAGGLPVIFTRSTWLQPWLTEYRVGFVCTENTIAQFCGYVLKLRGNPDLRIEMGQNARDLAEAEFSRDMIAQKYFELLQSVATKKQV